MTDSKKNNDYDAELDCMRWADDGGADPDVVKAQQDSESNAENPIRPSDGDS